MAKHAHNDDLAATIAKSTNYVPTHAKPERRVEAAKIAAEEIPLIDEQDDESWRELTDGDEQADA